MLRFGLGVDVHPFALKRPLVLGGVKIPSSQGLAGHSDADVLVHALMDALLGAAGLGDIGQHFPSSDPAYAGADSLELLERILGLLADRGFFPRQVDCTLLAERPALAPYYQKIREKLAGALGLSPDRVSVKATTTEKLGFIGREEGLAALVLAVIEGPD
ncbi:MAG: 2-C-methyl-D-erythritol 2,4-cyclodiphosphate synthase [Moorellales bacterium]